MVRIGSYFIAHHIQQTVLCVHVREAGRRGEWEGEEERLELISPQTMTSRCLSLQMKLMTRLLSESV